MSLDTIVEMKTYIINLEQSTERKEYMRQQESANENISTCCQNGAIFIYADMLSVYMEAV